jgi:enediyne core biosynthesis thioesterase
MSTYYEYQHVVTFADTNLVGNVYFANYLAWQGTCRERFLAEHAPGVVAMLGDDLALLTTSCSCEYFAELYAIDKVSVRMSLVGISGNRVSMDFGYYRVDPTPALLVARGTQVIACMRRTSLGLAATAVPDELTAALAGYAAGTSGSARQVASA